jgi:hypothetical protein
VGNRLSRPGFLERAEPWLVHLVALHTLAVGVVLLFATEWGLRFGGWSTAPPPFFPRQGGAFHLIAAFAYLWEYYRHGTVNVLLCAKAIATVFLLWQSFGPDVPWLVPVSAASDASMGIAVAWVRARVKAPRPA